MRHATVTATVGLAALLLLAGCAAPFTANAGTTDVNSPGSQVRTPDANVGTTVSVQSEGSVDAAADLAVVRVSVVATADDADTARRQVAADAERMRAALSDAGVADDAVRTVSFDIYPEYDHTERERELVGYRAVHSFEIEVAPDRAGRVVDVAVANGASQVDGVTFTLTEEARADLRAEAISEAMAGARADAEAVAAAEELTITGVHSASTGVDVGPVPMPLAERASDSAGGAPSTTFEPGPVTVSATVSVTYTAE